MKIDLMINSLKGGGAERVMATLANGFSLKNDVRIISFNEGCDYKLDPSVENIQLHHGYIKNHTIRSTFNLYKFYLKKSNRPTVLISFIHANNLTAIIVGNLLGIKVIVSEHNNHINIFSKKAKWIREFVYRFADALTVLTSFDEPYYKKHGANVTIMPNPINPPIKLNPFSKRKKQIILVGSLNRYKVKGFDSIIPIVAPILKANPSWNIKIAGGGDKGMDILKQIVLDYNLESRIEFIGFTNNIQELMQNSQIFILPSKFEGLPMGLMESLSNGMACIAYDCPTGPSDLIQNKINGLLIKNQDETSMYNGILKLISDDIFREKIASKASDSMQSYKLENILKKWYLLIESVSDN